MGGGGAESPPQVENVLNRPDEIGLRAHIETNLDQLEHISKKSQNSKLICFISQSALF